MKTGVQKFRPLFAKCAGVCTGTFILTFCSCIIAYESGNRHGESKLIWVFPILLAIAHLILIVFSIRRWNPYVYLYADSIAQVQWGREIVIPYGKIQNVKIYGGSPVYPSTITVYSDRRKITFDSSKQDVFLMHCTNEEINNRIGALQKR